MGDPEAGVGPKMTKTGLEGVQAAQSQDQPFHTRPTHSSLNQPGTAARRPVTRNVSLAILRDTIEAEFGLEILLKHKELRLIDQEFAKCQVALEQLRRCQIIPYPALSFTYEDAEAASTGSGPAFDNRALYASPWGVLQGPYTRHYQQWLIPDSSFDDAVPSVQIPTPHGKTLPDRATRSSNTGQGLSSSTSRSQRGSNGTELKALPHGYPEPKEQKGPMIVKRPSDGKMVKLICLDDRRSNFNSIQGFINHCRISHSRQFPNHDAAIEACGEEIDLEAEGLGEVNASGQATASAGLVHPLIRSAYSVGTQGTPTESATSSRRKKSQVTALSAIQESTTHTPVEATSTPRRTRPNALNGVTEPTVPFNPSPFTPHLSARLAKMEYGIDLDEAVTEATMRRDVDLTMLSDDEDSDEDIDMEDVKEQPEAPQSHSTRGVLRGGEISMRARSPSPYEQPPAILGPSRSLSQRPPPLPSISRHAPCPPPQYSDNEDQSDHDIPMLDSQSPFNLSPKTIESHTAPSLVSDDGDYDNTHSESESPSDAEGDDHEDNYIHAEVMDHDDMDLGEGSSNHHLGLGGKPHSPTVRRRSSAIRPPTAIHHEERHVSFVSPHRRQRRDSKAKEMP